ncbi:MAG: 7-carboxy-7-deazaguanine synthase QueE [Halobacteriovoraceae bacterium]|jgi:7-carboxy-7-deazaguanine synthase|nr:7-carboxy-7-deazaguanine synthase QueE [Halobacteriovoraceae bacterium]MBT5092937.1 7-carboxy-7-deazaguanine synthase QueE [Halobacteriovoraceae bacterium]
MSELQVNSIYLATEGEGTQIGTPQVFVRLQGCTIGCLNCDSKDTWDFNSELTQSIDEILHQVSSLSQQGKIKRVSITGGDPLHPSHDAGLKALVKSLKAHRYQINLEAAGTRISDELFDALDYISFDYKTPSTGIVTKLSLIERMSRQFPGKFQVKAVIENEADYRYVLDAYKKLEALGTDLSFPWCLTPAYNLEEEFPKERFMSLFKWNIEDGYQFRVIGQQHKWVFGPDQKQV